MKIRSVIPASILLSVAVALAGCAGSPSATSGVGVVTRDASEETASNMARTSGVLVVEDGCVRLENGTVPVFSAEDVTWDGTTLTYGTKSYAAGDEIVLGGGEYPADLSASVIPPECGDGPGWGVARSVDVAPVD